MSNCFLKSVGTTARARVAGLRAKRCRGRRSPQFLGNSSWLFRAAGCGRWHGAAPLIKSDRILCVSKQREKVSRGSASTTSSIHLEDGCVPLALPMKTGKLCSGTRTEYQHPLLDSGAGSAYYSGKQGISNRLTRASAGDSEEEASVGQKPKGTRNFTGVEMKKPPKGG